LTFEN